MTRVELKDYLSKSEDWNILGSDKHLIAENKKNNNITFELENNIAAMYFLDGDPICLRVPYSEMSLINGKVEIPNVSQILGSINI